MWHPNSQFVMSTELECLTSFSNQDGSLRGGVERFFHTLAALAPTLPGPGGIFNGYGRIYFDCGHVELAAAECDSPYGLALVVQQQQQLVGTAVARLRREGYHLLLANNNHSGLLDSKCPIWGSHENYMTERRPTQFASGILPFLTTRIFAGAGGVEHPSGRFLAAVRPVRMELATGGGTTERRAIHSTAREEHHMGPHPNRYRYHLILGDGHRSQYNLALQFGATALALKAVFFDDRLAGHLKSIGAFLPEDRWVAQLRRLNVLAQPGKPLRIDPMIPRTQRVYLDAARRYVDRLRDVPCWIPKVLHQWDETLTVFERLDRSWLAARLDAFIKYEYYTAVLREMGKTWSDLPRSRRLFAELALLDHSYHEFSNPESAFDRLEKAGALQHRVVPLIAPGEEAEPFVPDTTPRAKARARFIRENAKRGGFIVDWSCVQDIKQRRVQYLFDPLAEQYDPWRDVPRDSADWGLLPLRRYLEMQVRPTLATRIRTRAGSEADSAGHR